MRQLALESKVKILTAPSGRKIRGLDFRCENIWDEAGFDEAMDNVSHFLRYNEPERLKADLRSRQAVLPPDKSQGGVWDSSEPDELAWKVIWERDKGILQGYFVERERLKDVLGQKGGEEFDIFARERNHLEASQTAASINGDQLLKIAAAPEGNEAVLPKDLLASKRARLKL